MITPGANIILYAYNEDAPQHSAAKKWLEEQLSLPVSFGFSW
jgi:predicted nucleic acid-binding protein